MNALVVDASHWKLAEPFTDPDALARLIAYARDEANRTGQDVCAELLTAALLTVCDRSALVPNTLEPASLEPARTA